MNFKLSANVPEFRPRVNIGTNNIHNTTFRIPESAGASKSLNAYSSKLCPDVPEFVPRWNINSSKSHVDQSKEIVKSEIKNEYKSEFARTYSLGSSENTSSARSLSNCPSISDYSIAKKNNGKHNATVRNNAVLTTFENSSKGNGVQQPVRGRRKKPKKNNREKPSQPSLGKDIFEGTSATPVYGNSAYTKEEKEYMGYNSYKIIDIQKEAANTKKETMDIKKEPVDPPASWSSLFKTSTKVPSVKAKVQIEGSSDSSSRHCDSDSSNASQINTTKRLFGRETINEELNKQEKKNSVKALVTKSTSAVNGDNQSRLLTGIGRGKSIHPNGDIIVQKTKTFSRDVQRPGSSKNSTFKENYPIDTSNNTKLALLKSDANIERGVQKRFSGFGNSQRSKKRSDLVRGAKFRQGDPHEKSHQRGDLEVAVKGLIDESVSRNLVKLKASSKRASLKYATYGIIDSKVNQTNNFTIDCQSKDSNVFSIKKPNLLEPEKGLPTPRLPEVKDEEQEWPGLGKPITKQAVVFSYSDILRREVRKTYKEDPEPDFTQIEPTNSEKDWQEQRRKKKKEKKKQKKKEKKMVIRAEKERLGLTPKQPEITQKLTQSPITLDFGNLFEKLLKQSGSSPPCEDNKIKSTRRRPLLTTGVVSVASGLAKKNALDGRKKDSNKISLNTLDSTQPIRRRGKEREKPRRKKPTLLRKIIMKEREAKRKARELEKKRSENQEEKAGEGTDADNQSEPQEDSTVTDPMESTALDMLAVKAAPLSSLPEHVIKRIHSRKFREYCDHFITKEIGQYAAELLWDLQRFHNRAYQENPIKANAKRRLVSGLREISRHVKLKKLKCIFLASNLERIASEGGIDDYLFKIISWSKECNIPIVYPMTRQGLGKVLRKKVPVSAVGIFSYDGAQDKYKMLMESVNIQRQAYQDKVAQVANEPASGETIVGSEVLKKRKKRKPRDKTQTHKANILRL